MAGIKRMNYFQYEFLDAADFIDEQDYHRDMRYRHNKELHTWGIVSGLDVNESEEDQQKVVVGAGIAIDRDGKEIVLTESQYVDFAQSQAQIYYITISWNQQPVEPFQQVDDLNKSKRWEETPDISKPETKPTDTAVNLVLARVVLNADDTIKNIDTSEREYAAIEIGDDTVTSAKIREADGTTGQDTSRGTGVKTGHLQNGAVTEPKLANNAVTEAKLASNAVTASKIKDGSIGTAELANNAVTSAKIRNGSVGGADLANNAVTETKLANDAVTANKIRNGQVGNAELANNAVTEAKLGNNAVTPAKIKDGSVGAAELANGAVTEVKLANNAVTEAKLANDAVTASKIRNGHVGNTELANGAVTTPKIVNNTINETKLDAATRGKLVTNGNNHDHLGGEGAQIKHSSLKKNDGRNPHRTTAVDVEALPISGGVVSGSFEVSGGPTKGIQGQFKTSKAADQTEAALTVGAGASYINSPASRMALGVWADKSTRYGIFIHHKDANKHALWVNMGLVRFPGGKSAFVVDKFINRSGQTLHTGDVVKLKSTSIMRFEGDFNKIPIPDVTLADKENDTRVIGIVDREAVPGPDEPDIRTAPEDPTSIPNGGDLMVVTLGTYAHCKVDATDAPIEVGDLLTSSSKPGHARKAINPKIGCIIGKALEPLKEGTGYIAVFVNIQ